MKVDLNTEEILAVLEEIQMEAHYKGLILMDIRLNKGLLKKIENSLGKPVNPDNETVWCINGKFGLFTIEEINKDELEFDVYITCKTKDNDLLDFGIDIINE